MFRLIARLIGHPESGSRWHLLAALAVLSVPLSSCDLVRDFGAVTPECKPLVAIAKARAIDDDGPGEPPSDPPPPPPPPPTFAAIMEGFCGFDINSDGTAEINSLKPLFTRPEPYVPQRNGVVIVFVDPRLVADDSKVGVSPLEMMLHFGQLQQDLFKEGYYPYFVRANVYAGTRHQDGRTLLAMRRFLQRIRAHYPLSAALLVGSFPDASIVRTVLVKATSTIEQPVEFQSGSSPLTGYAGAYLATGSELITTRAEIVLADLDGNWERLYNEKLNVTNYAVLPPIPGAFFPFENQIVPTQTFKTTNSTFDDVFHILDHNAVISRSGGTLTMALRSLAEPSPEATAADKQLPNRIARPEIVVGRINPRSIAIQPYTSNNDLDGKQPLDSSGTPQTLRFWWPTDIRWRRDATLERRLVADYLVRAHAFRLGRDSATMPAVSSFRGPDNQLLAPAAFNSMLREAFGSLAPVALISQDNATSAQFVGWLKRPAALRGIATHCDSVNCQAAELASAHDLEVAAGAGMPGKGVWRWQRETKDNEYVLTPSFENMSVDMNFYMYRTMWQNKVMANAAQVFIIHDGCEVMRPSNSDTMAYNSDSYGQFDEYGRVANGESLMFYANGLGLMARNKVFNDTPNGFSQAVRASSGRFGYGWKGYFSSDAADTNLDERAVDATSPERRFRTLQRKRSYFWNMIGDPTLKLRY